MLKAKPKGKGLGMKTLTGTKDGKTYLVFRTPRNAYHVFVEVEAKQAAVNCGAMEALGVPGGNPTEYNPRQLWGALWKEE